MAARGICVSGWAVVEGIVINISVPGIETVIARVSAAVAPARIIPGRPGMPADARSEVRRVRCDAGAGESSRCNGRRKNESSRNAHYEWPTHDFEHAVSPQRTARWQIKTAGLVKQRRWSLLNDFRCAAPLQTDSPSPSSTAYCTVSDTRCQPEPLKPAMILMRTICTSLSCRAIVSTVVSRI